MRLKEQYTDDIKKVINHIPNLEKIYNKHILITGSTGMLCSSIVDILLYLNKNRNANISLLLAGRNRESVIKRYEDYTIDTHFQFVQFDSETDNNLCNISADYIIHGASNADPSLFSDKPVETIMGNIHGLNCLLKLAELNSARLLLVSSSEVYGKKESSMPYSESDYGYVDILNPRTCYPNSKRLAETLCSSYNREYGVDTVSVRPGHIYGPSIRRSDSRASAQFIFNAVDGRDIVMKSAGSQLRSYCYTLDCASATLTVLLNGQTNNAYNISNKDSIISIRQLAEILAEIANVNIIFETPTDKESAGYNLMDNSSLNSDKLEALGWSAVFGAEEGLAHTVESLI